MKLLIALPCYHTGTSVGARAIRRVYTSHPEWKVTEIEAIGSLLTAGFNRAWAHALNMRERGEITHFLMLHSDVRPRDENWIDILLAEMEKANVQVLSAIIPIKDARGMTSTALDTNLWRPMRFTMRQIHDAPVTWTDDRLLFNTGCLLVNFAEPWVEKVCFTVNDLIVKENGTWASYVEPEDWHFSRQCHQLGVRVAVTRAVALDHFGVNHWPNDLVWGEAADFQNIVHMADKRASEDATAKLAVVK